MGLGGSAREMVSREKVEMVEPADCGTCSALKDQYSVLSQVLTYGCVRVSEAPLDIARLVYWWWG
jgi:hypothetical protein